MGDPARALSPTSKARIKRQAKCYICKETMPTVTAAHLRTHGYTVKRYERMFGARRPLAMSGRSDQSLLKADQSPERSAAITELAERLGRDKVWLDTLTDEVGERMLNGPMRLRLTSLCATMLMHRAQVHAGAMTVMSAALNELQEDWRVTQGGKDGAPTPTEELLRVVEKAGKVVRDSEEAVQRTMKLALDEQRTASEYADGIGPTLYQGKAEKLNLPKGLTSGDRETMRGLLSILGRATAEARTIDVQQVPADSAATTLYLPDGTPPPPGVAPLPDATPDELMSNTSSGESTGEDDSEQGINSSSNASPSFATTLYTPSPPPPSSDPLTLISDPFPLKRRTRRRRGGALLPPGAPPPSATDPTGGPVNDDA